MRAKGPQTSRQRLARRRPEVVLTVVAAGMGVCVWAMSRPSDGSRIALPSAPAAAVALASSPPAPVPVAPASPQVSVVDLRHRLMGRWLRPDGGYILAIESITADGDVLAKYNNPQAIHVAKAQATNKGGQTALYVELRDRGYPGNNYTLNYDPDHDRLSGVYHHLGLGQSFDVSFERLRKEGNGTE